MENRDFIPGLVVTIALVGLGILLIWGLVKLILRIAGITGRKPKSKREPRPANLKTHPLAWILFFGAIGAAVVFSKPADANGTSLSLRTTIVAVIASIVGLGVIWFGVLILRYYDRDAARALKRWNSGDKDGAIAGLVAAMDVRKPSAIRSSTLGAFLVAQERYPEAYKHLLDAEAIGGRRPIFLGNRAVVLWKMGRIEEAAGLLEEAIAKNKLDIIMICNYSGVLADLGRFEEARTQLARAEALFVRTTYHSSSVKATTADQIDQLRKKLEGGPASRDQATFHEPL